MKTKSDWLEYLGFYLEKQDDVWMVIDQIGESRTATMPERVLWDALMEALSGVQALSAVPEAFLKSVIALCSHRGYSPANIEAWDKDDKWIADLWRQAESMLAASPTPPAEQQAAPKAAPGEQNTVPAELLEQAYREGWAACRDAETIGEEAEDWAFGNSTANSRMIDAQQAAPQQEAQEPCGWAVYDSLGFYELHDTEADAKSFCDHYNKRPIDPKKPYTYRAHFTAPQPAPPSDDVARDAARYRWLRATTNYVTSKGERIDVRNMPEKWDAAIDAAIAAQGGKV